MVTEPIAARKRGFLHRVIEGAGVSCEIGLPSGRVERFGDGPPQFRVNFKTDRLLRLGFDEFAFASAYVNGEVEIHGDMTAVMQLRSRLKDKMRVSMWLKFLSELLLAPETRINREAISAHYQFGDELYLSFIDQRYRFYSQGIFHSEDDSLEQASENKLENIFRAVQLKSGMRLLDIGGGWGGVVQYFGSRGIRVTALTLGEDSERFIGNLIREQGLPCEVILQDFLTFHPAEPFDAISICGVIEHIPNYARFSDQVWKCLRPDGVLFLDASASLVKYDVSAFARKYIWPGTHSYLCVQDLIRELLFHGMELVRVENESAHYARTMQQWAQRLEQNREMVIERWSEKVYRAFHLYLWTGARAFPDLLQAYHLVARRMEPRPPVVSKWRRALGLMGR